MLRTLNAQAACLLLFLFPACLAADSEVERIVDARPNGTVEISNVAGSVTVIGWGRSQVEITGTLGGGVEKLEVESSGKTIEIEVRHFRRSHGRGGHADLKIRVPVGSELDIEVVSAEVEISGVEGEVTVESVSGSVHVEGSPVAIDVESVSGAIEIEARVDQASAESVSGRISLSGAIQEIEAGSVSGRIEVRSDTIRTAELSTTSGEIELTGSLSAGAEIEAESHSGSIELNLPSSASARFTVETYSGRIDNQLGPPAKKTSRYTPGKELEFSIGGGDARIEVGTFSGSISLRRQ